MTDASALPGPDTLLPSPDPGVPGPDTVLTDERLVLRLPQEGDVPAITAACQDETRDRWVAEDGEKTWAVTGAADGRLLAMVGLHARDASMREIGFWAAPWARGRGVMTGAARLALRFAFDELRLERVEWRAVVGNEASRRVADKLGFVQEGTLRAGLLHRGERVDGWVAGLLPGELT